MCGRVEIRYDQEGFIDILVEIKKRWPDLPFDSGEYFPSDLLPVLHYDDNNNYIADMVKWGYRSKSNKKLINARSETVEEKSTFAQDFLYRRAIIPVSGFYEWDKDKNKYYYEDQDHCLLFLAGLLNKENNEVIIMTREAGKAVRGIHKRCPVLIKKSDRKQWMTNIEFSRELLLNPNKIGIKATRI